MGYLGTPLIKRAGALSNYILAEDGSTQIALFTYASNVTTLEGGDTAGDDNIFKSNSAQTYSQIRCYGGGKIEISPQTSLQINFNGTDGMDLSYSSNVTTISGPSLTGDDFKQKANQTDDYPYTMHYGNAGITHELKSTGAWVINEETSLRMQYNTANQNLNIGLASISNDYDLGLFKDGVLCIKETTTPTADTNYGKIYCKNDDKLYFQDGAGTEHEIAYA